MIYDCFHPNQFQIVTNRFQTITNPRRIVSKKIAHDTLRVVRTPRFAMCRRARSGVAKILVFLL